MTTMRQRLLHQVREQRGVSLFEVTLLLAAAVLVTAALMPALLRMIHDSRQQDARAEMRALHQAMVGSDEDGTYGFVGDMGRLPFELGELVDGTGLPLAAASPASGVSAGWDGPYLNRGEDDRDYRVDPWGNPYELGVPSPGQIRSFGPAGLPDDGDDIVYPPNPVDVHAALIVTVKGHSGELITTDPDDCVVTLHFAAGGVDTTVVDESPPFSFTDVHRGLHTVEATCSRFDGGTATDTTVARVQGNSQQALEIHLELGAAPIGEAESSEADETDTPGAQAPARSPQR